MKLYHGSPRNFEKFEKPENMEWSDSEEEFEAGCWFTDDKERAARYAAYYKGDCGYIYTCKVPYYEYCKNEGQSDEYLVNWENVSVIYIVEKEEITREKDCEEE